MRCAMGVDLSRGDDFCAFTFYFPMPNGTFGVKGRSYVTEKAIKGLPSAMRAKYDELVEEGSLIVMPGSILENDTVVYDDLDKFISDVGYDICAVGYDPYGAKEFVSRWVTENGPFGVEKVIQGARTESVPLGELKHLSEERELIFDQKIMTFTMGNSIVLEDTNGNRKLVKNRYDEKIDNVSALLDAHVAYKLNREAFD